MNQSTIQKLLLAKCLFRLSSENLKSKNDIALNVCVNLLQDAVEAFLLAVSEHVNANIKEKTNFHQYFDLINEKIKPNELPFRQRLFHLNKLRIHSKHFGLALVRSEVEGLVPTVNEFFREVSKQVFEKSFSTISLVDLVKDGESKKMLLDAEKYFASREYEQCLVFCRKAIFIRFESCYSIAPYDVDKPIVGLADFWYKPPLYSRNRAYIKEFVDEPTNFIVFNPHDLDMELIKCKLDSVEFWNILRHTPKVFRRHSKSEWIVKREYEKIDGDGLEGRAEYVLDATISLFVSDTSNFSAIKQIHSRKKYCIKLIDERVPIRKKADNSSEVVETTPPGLTRLYVDFEVGGFKQGEYFYHVFHSEENIFLRGYLSTELTMGCLEESPVPN